MPKGLLQDIVAVRHLRGHRLWLRFEDGTEGEVDLHDVIRDFRGVLSPLLDASFVAKVQIHPEFGTITWPGELDLDPVVLYCAVRGIPVPTYDEEPRPRSSATQKLVRRDRPKARGTKSRPRKTGG